MNLLNLSGKTSHSFIEMKPFVATRVQIFRNARGLVARALFGEYFACHRFVSVCALVLVIFGSRQAFSSRRKKRRNSGARTR